MPTAQTNYSLVVDSVTLGPLISAWQYRVPGIRLAYAYASLDHASNISEIL